MEIQQNLPLEPSPLPLLSWRIYYDDGSVCDSTTHIQDVPTLGVEVISQKDDDLGRRLIFRYDYYYFQGEWYGSDLFGLWDYLQRPGLKRVLFGRTVSEVAFRKLYKRAVEDPRLPPKSAWLPREKLNF